MKELEQHIKQQLEDRKIVPTATAWDKVQAEIQPTPKKNKFWIWKSIAAVLAIGFIIGFFTLNKNENQSNQPLVEKTSTESNENQAQELISPTEMTNPVATEDHHSQDTEAENSMVSTNTKEPSKSTNNKLQKEFERAPEIAQNDVDEIHEDLELNSQTTVPSKLNLLKTPQPEWAQNMSENQKSEVEIKKNLRKTSPDKLLFYIENEKQLKKPNRIAFKNNNIQIDLSQD